MRHATLGLTIVTSLLASAAWIAGCSSSSGSPGSPDASARTDSGGGSGGSSGSGSGGSSGGSGGGVVSCSFTVSGMRVCTQFTGLSIDASTVEETACQGNAGTFASTACSTAAASGTCTFVSSGTGMSAGIPAGTTVEYVYYSLSAQQITQAQQSCTQAMGGTWG